MDMTDEQLDQSVGFEFNHVSSFEIRASTFGGSPKVGRNFIFATMSEIVELCDDYFTNHSRCEVFGDPHISAFDQPERSSMLASIPTNDPEVVVKAFDQSTALLDTGNRSHSPWYGEFLAGDFWLVKSKFVLIQARYREVQFSSEQAKAQTFMTEMAVGGPFLKNHTLLIRPRSGTITWDYQHILKSLPSDFVIKDLISAKYHNASALVRNPRKLTAGLVVDLPSSVQIHVNRFRKFLDVSIDMPQSAGGLDGIDGQCGNFNGNPNDDVSEMIGSRMSLRVQTDETLFAEV